MYIILPKPDEMHIRENGVVNWTLAIERMHGLSSTLLSCKRAFKSPSFIRSQTGMEGLRDVWPDTKLVIGLRHPVSWFQSFYNYKIYRLNTTLPSPAVNMPCGADGVCVRDANFHTDIAKLALTPLNSKKEMDLLGVFRPFNRNGVLDQPVQNEVFLYEYSELHTEDLRVALTNYLDLEIPLKKLGEYRNHQTLTKKPGQIDICEERHSEVRSVLVEIGSAAAQWIKEFFLKSPSVVTTGSSFDDSLLQWQVDPCS